MTIGSTLPKNPTHVAWNIDSEIAFVDSLGRYPPRSAVPLLRGYLRGLEARTRGFKSPDEPLNEGIRGQLRGRARVHLNDLQGR